MTDALRQTPFTPTVPATQTVRLAAEAKKISLTLIPAIGGLFGSPKGAEYD